MKLDPVAKIETLDGLSYHRYVVALIELDAESVTVPTPHLSTLFGEGKPGIRLIDAPTATLELSEPVVSL